MSKEIRADYNQQLLFPPAVEDWVPSDHPTRFIREFVDWLDLKQLGFKETEGEEGRPHYAKDLLLKVWLYGYMNRIRSSRRLEGACREHVSLIWLTGGHEPDHNTLWRFWHENRKALRRLFKEVVALAVRAGAVGMVLQALDGTKLRAAVSKRTGWHRRDLEKLLKEVEHSLVRVESEIERGEKKESGSYRLPEELQEREKLRERIGGMLRELDEAAEDHLHPGDGEARMMRCEGKVEFGYNAQMVVDEKKGMIVAQDVVSEEADNQQLIPMLEQVEENLGEVAEETVSDGGYFSGPNLAQAEEKGYSVLVPLNSGQGERGEYHTCHFHYDSRHDCCICPRGEKLTFERVKGNRRKSYRVRVYRCRSYRECPVRWQCSRDKRGRSIEIPPHYQALLKQRKKQQSENKKALMSKRKQIAELPFAHIKHHAGFRRLTVRGIPAVRTQWALICTTLNLRILYKLWIGGELLFGA